MESFNVLIYKSLFQKIVQILGIIENFKIESSYLFNMKNYGGETL